MHLYLMHTFTFYNKSDTHTPLEEDAGRESVQGQPALLSQVD